MVRQLALIGAAVGLCFSAATTAVAQEKPVAKGSAPHPGWQFGPVAGANIFTFGGSDASGVKSRTTFYAGGALTIPLGASAFLQPEVLYAGKGAKASVVDTTVGTIDGEFKMAYLEVPVLLGVNLATSGARPRIYAGPTVGLNLSCDIAASVSGLSLSASCSSVGMSVKSLDFGVTGGVGLSFPVGSGAFSIDGRYTLGLTKILENSNLKNQGFSVGAGFMLPLGGH
jgi:hypothetical protein